MQSDIKEVTSALLVYHHNGEVPIKKAPRRPLLSVIILTLYLSAGNMDGVAQPPRMFFGYRASMLHGGQ